MKNLPITLSLYCKLVLLFGLSCFFSLSLEATIINVSPGTAAIQSAVNAATSGDTLAIANGTYNESVDLGRAQGDITLISVNPGGATVNGGMGSAFFAANHTGDINIIGLIVQSSSTDASTAVVNISNLTGRLQVSSCRFALGGTTQIFTPGIKVEQNQNNLSTQLSILSNSFGAFNNDDFINIESSGTGGDTDIVIDGNSNTSTMEDNAIQIDIDRINTTGILVVRNNIFSGFAASGAGYYIRCDGDNAQYHVLIEGNTITEPDGHGMFLDIAATNSDIFATIDNNTITGNATLANNMTETGFFLDDESSAYDTDITAFFRGNTISNTLRSNIRIRPFNDEPNTVNRYQIVIDNNNFNNPNADSDPIGFEEAGVDISDDSGIDDERYVVDAEITNNTFTNINSVSACILVEEPTTMTTGTAVVEYLTSGNTGCTSPTIRGSAAAVADPVPSSAALGSIGDFVWLDANKNGVQDVGEPGIPNVTIAFSNGTFSGTTTTNGVGNYIIPSLEAGTYTLTITPPGVFPFLVPPAQGSDATKDSDFDPTTNQASLSLAAGAENEDIDAGLTVTNTPNCPTLTFASNPVDEDCPGANDGSISIGSPVGGMAPYTYSIDSGAVYVATSTFGSLAPGVYDVRIQDANGCESDALAVTIGGGVDVTDPVISCPADQTVFLDAGCMAIVGSYNPASVSDNCTNSPTIDQSPPALTPITSNTMVTLTAIDASGNSAACSLMVMVSDTIKPTITGVCGSTDSLYVDTSCNALVPDYALLALASDNCGGASLALNSPMAGTSLSIGVYVGTLDATDASSNRVSCAFSIVVLDTISPSIVCPPTQTVIRDTTGFASLDSYSPASAMDNCVVPTISQIPAAMTMIIGDTTVTLSAEDASGNISSCSFLVMVDSMAMSINDPRAAIQLKAFPNPTTGLLQVELAGVPGQAYVAEVIDIHGKLIQQKSMQTTSTQFDLSACAEGVYFLKISNEMGDIAWKKVLVE